MKRSKTVKDSKSISKRRNRSQFRTNFKERCAYSFAQSVDNLYTAHEDIFDDNIVNSNITGLKLSSACKYLSHSIEMLCKDVLSKVSPYLLLEDYKLFNERDSGFEEKFIDIENTGNGKYCGAGNSLGRAFKIFKYKLNSEELNLLEDIIKIRNEFEHKSSFYIISLESFADMLVAGQRVVSDIFSKEYRNGDLILYSFDYASYEDLIVSYEKLQQDYSEKIKSVRQKVIRLQKKNKAFRVCDSCHYKFALIDGNKCRCELCRFESHKVKCSIKNCDRKIWIPIHKKTSLCDYHEWQEDLFDSMTTNDILKNDSIKSKINKLDVKINYSKLFGFDNDDKDE